jgi:hypothetical protein
VKLAGKGATVVSRSRRPPERCAVISKFEDSGSDE